MAAVRVQNYLKKHKIGPLFESLMARVIQDTPDDPIGYIIEILQGVHKNPSKQLESSFNGHMSPRSSRQTTRPQSGGNRRRSNHLAASWSAGVDQRESGKQENQLKTWTGNDFKTVKNETWSSDKQTAPQPVWNNDTRVPTHDFDELFQMQNGGATQIKSSQTQDRYHGVQSWDNDDGKPGEQRISYEPDDNDELSRELRLGSKQPNNNIRETSVPMTSGSRAHKTSRRAVEKHRKELQALLLEEGSGKKTRTTKQSSPEERGTEIFERMEDLQNEGVNDTPSLKGAKLDKLKRTEKKEVSVTICARCARIIGDNDDINSLSEAGSTDFNSRLFNNLNRKQDLHDIDSASETSENMGLRERNTWPLTDSEQEATPRNHTVSFSKFDRSFRNESENGFNKSSDIFDDDSPIETQRSSRTKTSSRSRNSHFDFTKAAGNSSGWGLADDESDNESNYSDTMQPRSRSQASGSIKGRAWNRNPGNISDDDSTIT